MSNRRALDSYIKVEDQNMRYYINKDVATARGLSLSNARDMMLHSDYVIDTKEGLYVKNRHCGVDMANMILAMAYGEI